MITNNAFKRASSDFSLTAGFATEINTSDESDVPKKSVVFTEFSSLQPGDRVNLYGLTMMSSDVETVNEYTKLSIKLGDTKNMIEAVIWNEQAIKQGSITQGEIIAIEDTVVKNFRGNLQCSGGYITTFRSTKLDDKLQHWWSNTDCKQLPLLDNMV